MTEDSKSRIPNYEKGIIYKLCCKDPTITECYIGSTTNFTKRKNQHKTRYNNQSQSQYVYQFIRDNRGFENWDMIQIEEYKASNKRDLETRERYWIETLKSQLNSIIPTRTGKEYREANKETILQYNKEYREANKETMIQYNKEYREANKETIKQKKKDAYESKRDIVIQKAKDYYKANKEIIPKQRAEYYKANSDIIKQKKGEKITCNICGSIISRGNISIHNKSKKHIAKLNNS